MSPSNLFQLANPFLEKAGCQNALKSTRNWVFFLMVLLKKSTKPPLTKKQQKIKCIGPKATLKLTFQIIFTNKCRATLNESDYCASG